MSGQEQSAGEMAERLARGLAQIAQLMAGVAAQGVGLSVQSVANTAEQIGHMARDMHALAAWVRDSESDAANMPLVLPSGGLVPDPAGLADVIGEAAAAEWLTPTGPQDAGFRHAMERGETGIAEQASAIARHEAFIMQPLPDDADHQDRWGAYEDGRAFAALANAVALAKHADKIAGALRRAADIQVRVRNGAAHLSAMHEILEALRSFVEATPWSGPHFDRTVGATVRA